MTTHMLCSHLLDILKYILGLQTQLKSNNMRFLYLDVYINYNVIPSDIQPSFVTNFIFISDNLHKAQEFS